MDKKELLDKLKKEIAKAEKENEDAGPGRSPDGAYWGGMCEGLQFALGFIEQTEGNPITAAAPDLLAELENIATAETWSWDDASDFEAWAKSRARHAIAKAKAKGGLTNAPKR